MNKDETHKNLDNDVTLSVWLDGDTWVGCWSGMYQGLYSESDDIELDAKSQKEALKEIEDEYHNHIQAMKETEEDYQLNTLTD